MKEQSREQRLMEDFAMEAALWLRDSREDSEDMRRREEGLALAVRARDIGEEER